MIRQSFFIEQIHASVAAFDAQILVDTEIDIVPTQRGSVAVVDTTRGKWVLKYADLECSDTEIDIHPARSFGLENEAKYLTLLDGVGAPPLVGYAHTEQAVCVATGHIAGNSALDTARDTALPRQAIVGRYISLIDGIHRLGIRHGDTQPGNAIVATDNNITLIDFEFAHFLDEPALAPGLYHFLSPAAAQRIIEHKMPLLDQREETFSLALGCLALLAGQLPLRYSREDIPRMHAIAEIADGVPYGTDGVRAEDTEIAQDIIRILRKSPADRPETPAELREMLGHHLPL